MKSEQTQETNASLNGLYSQAVSRSVYALPFYMAVPVLYGLVFHAVGQPIRWGAFGIGALGWLAALILRGPVGALGMRLTTRNKAQTMLVASSGPLEEGVRWGLLTLTGASFSQALSLGQGWAAVEVLFTLINGIVLISLAGRTDEKAMQAKEMLRTQGHLTASPLWGLAERVSASAYHIGATLVIAKLPWTVLLLIPFHSLFNIVSVQWQKKSLILTEGFVAAIGAAVLAAGLIL